MKKIPSAIIAGHICIDFTPPFEGARCNAISDVLAPGKLVKVGPAFFHPGGVVVNTGLAMKILGADVTLMGKVGNDAFGRMILDILKGYGADSGIITDSKSSTSYTVVLAIPGIDRIFLHNPGANDTFSADDIDYSACEDATLFHFGYPPLMKRMYESDGRELTEIFRRAKSKGCITSLDMAAIDEASDVAQADWIQILSNTLPYVDFFMPSIEETCFMLDRKKYYELQERASGEDVTHVISIKNDAAPLAESLLGMGCKLVLLKCGSAGFYYRSAGTQAFAELSERSGIDFSGFAERDGFERSFVPDALVSGTGAGDTTIAAFLASAIGGYPFEKCIDFASATGACCVASLNALDGLKSFDELEARIIEGWPKQNLLNERE